MKESDMLARIESLRLHVTSPGCTPAARVTACDTLLAELDLNFPMDSTEQYKLNMGKRYIVALRDLDEEIGTKCLAELKKTSTKHEGPVDISGKMLKRHQYQIAILEKRNELNLQRIKCIKLHTEMTVSQAELRELEKKLKE